jgi:AraC family transcriptional regulator, regulatory protein of adaptative response / DNA-3-methyladenine glycosylase II
MTPTRVRLSFQAPLEPSNLYGHLAATAVPGVEEYRDGRFRAAVLLPHGPSILDLALPTRGAVPAVLWLSDDRDRDEAVARSRRLLDLDTDPAAAAAVLRRDPVLAPLLTTVPGRRVPGAADPTAMALRAVLGQQISTAAARTHAARLVRAYGEPVADPEGTLTHRFPTPGALVAGAAGLADVARMPATRRATLLALATALASGTVRLADPLPAVRRALAALPGIGPWTIETIAMRALGDGDAFLPGDLGVRLAATRLGLPGRPAELERRSRSWSPHRAVAVQYLWATGSHPVNRLPAERAPSALPGVRSRREAPERPRSGR